MSDNDIGDEVPTHELTAIAAFQHDNGYVLALMGDDGTLTTYTLSGPRMRQVVTIMSHAIQGIPSGSIQLMRDLGEQNND